jgi:hypothetical protein
VKYKKCLNEIVSEKEIQMQGRKIRLSIEYYIEPILIEEINTYTEDVNDPPSDITLVIEEFVFEGFEMLNRINRFQG